MPALLLLVEQADEGQISQIARTFGVDWPHLGAQIVSFAIVCLVLYKFAYRNVLAMLEERRQQIAHGIANAEKIKAELEKTESVRQQVLGQAYAQSAKILEEARAAGARVAEAERQKAIASAQQIMTKAHEAAAQDREQMAAELKREVGRWVVRGAVVMTGKVLTPEDQRRLAEEALRAAAA